MVGVPGRSNACNTCKQRKVACSLEKPECRTCINSSRVCTGYQRERVFILDQRTQCDGPKSYRKPINQSTTTVLDIRKRSTKPNSSHNSQTKVLDAYDSFSRAISIIAAPSTSPAYRKQVLSNFLCSIVPDRQLRIPNPVGEEAQPGSWVTMVPTLPEITAALESSLLAICTAKMGRQDKNPALVHESLKFYTKGLIELQRALWDPKLMYKDETLAACMSLVLYEVLECPDNTIKAWQSHMKGCAKLFETRGAEAYGSDFGHQIFLSWRLMEIQAALTERRSTCLSTPAWLEKPWKDRTKNSFHKFLDIMASLPTLLADGYKLLGPAVASGAVDPSSLFTGMLDLLKRCWEMDAQLQSCYEDLENTNLGPIYWPILSAEKPPVNEDQDIGVVFPVSFHFQNLKMSHLCMLYWASTAILWSGMGYSYKMLETFGVNPSIFQLPPLGHRADVTPLARNICQSLEYCMKDEHRGLGKTTAAMPLKVAIEILHDAGCERELAWAVDAMLKIGGTAARLMCHLGVPMTDHAYLPG